MVGWEVEVGHIAAAVVVAPAAAAELAASTGCSSKPASAAAVRSSAATAGLAAVFGQLQQAERLGEQLGRQVAGSVAVMQVAAAEARCSSEVGVASLQLTAGALGV